MRPTLSLLCAAALAPLALTGCGGSGAKEMPAPLEAKAPSGDKIELKLNLPKGSKKKLAAKMNIVMNVEADGTKIDLNMNMGMDMGFEVLDVDAGGNHELSFTFDRIKMLVLGGPEDVDYDSSRPGSDQTPIGQGISPMLGHAITMTMAPNGEVVEVADMRDAPPSLRDQFSQSQDNFEMVATFPEGPVDNGDTWTLKSSKAESGMDMEVNATYTLLEHKDGVAHIGVHGEMGGDLEGWIHGEMKIDIETGWVESADLKMHATGDPEGAEVHMDTVITFGS